MGGTQRLKGKAIERQACHFLDSIGIKARRERQNDGKLDPDIVFEDHPDWWCEVKGVKTFRPWHEQARAWIEKNETDSPPWKTCFVLAKVHGTSTWALGWKSVDNRYMWVFGADDIRTTLEGWDANRATAERLIARTPDRSGA